MSTHELIKDNSLCSAGLCYVITCRLRLCQFAKPLAFILVATRLHTALSKQLKEKKKLYKWTSTRNTASFHMKQQNVPPNEESMLPYSIVTTASSRPVSQARCSSKASR